jgi:hypothetical protein
MKIILAILVLISLTAVAQTPVPQDSRYCRMEPERRADGRIARSGSVLRAFQRIHPCPVTGSGVGPCPGWAIDHIIPLACGGCDDIHNLQWLPNGIKSAPKIGKDRFERLIYCRPMQVVQ